MVAGRGLEAVQRRSRQALRASAIGAVVMHIDGYYGNISLLFDPLSGAYGRMPRLSDT